MLGTTVAGRYRLKEAIGRGGMGTVWRAEDLHEDHDTALKILPVGEGDPVREATFRREAQVAARLSHPNIVAVREYGAAELDGQRILFLAMDLVAGRPLNTLTGRPHPLHHALTWTIQISQALEAAHHRGIVHRDLKPSNILLDQASGNAAKLCDFGIARLGESTHHTLTVTGVAIGTPAYMSPEQARGDTTLSAPSDLYSLGCLLHELITGHVPFTGTGWQLLNQHLNAQPAPLSTLRPGLPHELEQLVLELLDKNPDRRPTAADTRTRLTRLHAALAADAPTATAHHHPPTRASDGRHREPGARSTTVCAASLTAAVIAGALTLTTTLPTPWASGLGALAGLLLASLYLLDQPQQPNPGRVKFTTAALMTLLLLASGAALGVLVADPSRWATALAISVFGGPALVVCTSGVRHLVEHALHRTSWHSDLATTAGTLQTATVLLIAHHVGLSPLTLIVAGAALWPTAALLTAVLTPLRNRHSPPAPPRTGNTGLRPPLEGPDSGPHPPVIITGQEPDHRSYRAAGGLCALDTEAGPFSTQVGPLHVLIR
ncbi:serine/threonine-protein kinase [Streptomyces clavuligerus]|uniref:serine/threonine-protein kinase n=2 Tax=Streptomyces clavuligerus TaxID=1901 RepID=UPI0002EB72CC|nr:serine/threonine-protein kinase [Streptomyces clavuligerus]WDN55895.1 serine/threonine protein kinase [Streptomyces clavuligerus]